VRGDEPGATIARSSPRKSSPRSGSTEVIVAVKYDSGILLASDTVIHHGRSPRFTGVSHFRQLTPTVVIGTSGQFADFQALLDVLLRPLRQAQWESYGQPLTVSEIYFLVKRYLYMRRTRMDPLALEVIVAGIAPDGAPFLGTAFEDDFACASAASSSTSPSRKARTRCSRR
jgi:20S proteasome subunit beta 7